MGGGRLASHRSALGYTGAERGGGGGEETHCERSKTRGEKGRARRRQEHGGGGWSPDGPPSAPSRPRKLLFRPCVAVPTASRSHSRSVVVATPVFLRSLSLLPPPSTAVVFSLSANWASRSAQTPPRRGVSRHAHTHDACWSLCVLSRTYGSTPASAVRVSVRPWLARTATTGALLSAGSTPRHSACLPAAMP